MHERKSVRTSTDGEGEVPSGILRAGGSPSIRRYIYLVRPCYSATRNAPTPHVSRFLGVALVSQMVMNGPLFSPPSLGPTIKITAVTLTSVSTLVVLMR